MFTNVSRNGDWINYSCPLAPYSPDHKFKADASPSCGSIVTDTLRTHTKCYTCKYQGSFINLLKYLQSHKKNVDYSSIIESISKQEDFIPEYENRFFIKETKKIDPLEYSDLFDPVERFPDAMRYLDSRKISLVTARKLHLGYHSEHRRIVFPVKDLKNNTYGFTGRSIDPEAKPRIMDYYFPKSMFILGVELWKEQPSILVEGLFGFAHIHEITKGKYFPFNIGAIMGSSLSDEQAKTLTNFGCPTYCLLDNDPAGKAGMFGSAPKPDWSQSKRKLERDKGMVYKLCNDIPTFSLKWPQDKLDPDQLTYDELCCMLQKPRLVIG